MAQDFRDRLLSEIYNERSELITWSKTLASITAGRAYHLFQFAGSVTAGAYTGSALAATAITGGSSPTLTTGVVNLKDPSSGYKGFLTSAQVWSHTANENGTLIICDLLATYQGFNGNTLAAQPTTGSASGSTIITRYTDGYGVMLMGDIQTTLGATPANVTVTYTNSSGTGSKVTTASAVTTSGTAGTILNSTGTGAPFLPLASGDVGVRSVQSVSLSAATGSASTFAICLVKPLAIIPASILTSTTHISGVMNGVDQLTSKVIKTGAALTFIWLPANSTSNILYGSFNKTDISYP